MYIGSNNDERLQGINLIGRNSIKNRIFWGLKSPDGQSVESRWYSGIHSKETNQVDQNIPHLPSIKQMKSLAEPTKRRQKQEEGFNRQNRDWLGRWARTDRTSNCYSTHFYFGIQNIHHSKLYFKIRKRKDDKGKTSVMA